MFASEDLIHDVFACMIDIIWCWSAFILLFVVVFVIVIVTVVLLFLVTPQILFHYSDVVLTVFYLPIFLFTTNISSIFRLWRLGEEMTLDECDYYTPRGKSSKLTDCTDLDLTTVPKDIFKTKAKFM